MRSDTENVLLEEVIDLTLPLGVHAVVDLFVFVEPEGVVDSRFVADLVVLQRRVGGEYVDQLLNR